MPPLHMQIPDGENGWKTVAQITRDMPSPSISDNHENGRDVYLFGVEQDKDQGFVSRSIRGIDMADSAIRAINALDGFETVATLNPGESHEMTVKTDVSPAPRSIRFMYESDETK